MALIGFASPPCKETTLSVQDSFIGGSLIAHNNIHPPPDEEITCRTCQRRACFVAQLYCPLSNSEFHRNLCFFVCLTRTCQTQGSNWIVLRSQSIAAPEIKEKIDGSNDWTLGSDSDEDDAEVMQTSGSLSTLETDSKDHHSLQPNYIGIKSPFDCRFLDIYEDTVVTTHDSDDVVLKSGTPSTAKAALAAWSRSGEEEKEFIEEDDNTMGGAFSGMLSTHLASRGEHGCEDFRYAWAGMPIFNGLPPIAQLEPHLHCRRCGAPRVYEMQLFSTLNNSLTLNSSVEIPNLTPTDFVNTHLDETPWFLKVTTVLVFSCVASCWEETDEWFSECVVVQTDEDRTCICDGESVSVVTGAE